MENQQKRIPPVTAEQLERGHQKFLEHCRAENGNSMLVWWPKIKNLGIPVPKTEFVPIAREEMMESAVNGTPLSPGVKDSITQVRALADSFGYPVFIRSDLSSGKHSWKNTCFVRNPDEIEGNIINLCGEHELWTLLGLNYKAIAVREFLELEATFTAFSGDMPINKERRYFIQNGEVICHHPYWPADAFNSHPARMAGDSNWREKLEILNAEDTVEIGILSTYARVVSNALPGFWSVDFAKTKSGVWYLIDMALGENSYHWPGCENNPNNGNS